MNREWKVPRGSVWAFDLAPSCSGWCAGPLDGVPSFGTWAAPEIGGPGARYAAFNDLLYQVTEKCRPGKIIIEAPLPPQAQTDNQIARDIYKQAGDVREAAWRASIDYSEVGAAMARTEVIGRCRWENRQEGKLAIIRFCRDELHLAVDDDNAADACIIWTWHKQRVLRIPPRGRLFAAE